jgi:WD40 repeat protein
MRIRYAIALVTVVVLGTAPAAHATSPGANGKLAFTSSRDGNSEIYSMNADGSGLMRLTNDPGADGAPAWSPDGHNILFVSNRSGSDQIWVMTEFGGAPTQLTTAGGSVPVWYPDGSSFEYMLNGAVHRRALDGSSDVQLTSPNPPCDYLDPETDHCDRYVDFDLSPDGTQHVVQREHEAFAPCPARCGDTTSLKQFLSIGTQGASPSWAPDQSRIAFDDYSWDEFTGYHYGLGTVRPDATDKVILRDGPAFDPAWSPDGTKIAFSEGSPSHIKLMNRDGTNVTDIGEGASPDWQPVPQSYARPKGATPFTTHFVTAFKQCTAPNRTHGAPLSFPSCNPPVQTSDFLTVGTGDSNGAPAKSIGSVRYDVFSCPACAGPGPNADVRIAVSVLDVRNKSDLSDYTGELQVDQGLRMTDRNNTPNPGGPGPATVADTNFPVTVPCSATGDTTIGSSCAATTSANALVPNAVAAGFRAIWQLGQVEVSDGGPDGVASTSAGNTLFMVEGVFVP